MISRELYWKQFSHEMHCVRHLANKITPDMLDYRPTPKQRSMLELLQYHSFIYIAMMYCFANETMDDYGPRYEKSKGVTLETFQDVMHQQEADMLEIFDMISDDDMNKEYDFYGVRTKAGHLLVALNMITAYKMQLFLYIKSCGVETISTMDLWAGMDTPQKTD